MEKKGRKKIKEKERENIMAPALKLVEKTDQSNIIFVVHC